MENYELYTRREPAASSTGTTSTVEGTESNNKKFRFSKRGTSAGKRKRGAALARKLLRECISAKGQPQYMPRNKGQIEKPIAADLQPRQPIKEELDRSGYELPEDRQPPPEPSEMSCQPEREEYKPVSEHKPIGVSDLVEVMNRFVSQLEHKLHEHQRLLNRQTTCVLPEFTGDPLEWLYFKKVYDFTTEMGGYSERENVMRLYISLQGEARESVRLMLATSNDATAIMNTLELLYGNKHLIAGKIAAEIRNVPQYVSDKFVLMQYATKIKNAVTAIRALDLVNYFTDPLLVEEIKHELSYIGMECNFYSYSEKLEDNLTELEKVADMLGEEVKSQAYSGVFN